MTSQWLKFVGGVLLFSGLAAARSDEVRVLGEQVNLRASPSMQSEVVGQIVRGQVLKAGPVNGDWVQIEPPENIHLWVYGELVRDGAAAASSVLVRAGPGINYRAVGRLEKGDRVVVRGASASGEWLKIVAPKGCTLWTSRKYVEVLPGTAPAAGAPPVTNAPPIAVPDGAMSPAAAEPAASAATDSGAAQALKGLTLETRDGQGRVVQVEGTLRPAGMGWNRPSAYRLVQTDRKGHVTFSCYVKGSDALLQATLGKQILLYGREYWVVKVKDPVVVIDQVIPRNRPGLAAELQQAVLRRGVHSLQGESHFVDHEGRG